MLVLLFGSGPILHGPFQRDPNVAVPQPVPTGQPQQPVQPQRHARS